MTDNVVTVRGLRKSYGDRVVVDGLDLDVPEGEVVGLIGANGAGKTTAVECIQGLRRPDAGAIDVLGHDPAVEPERVRRLIGSQLQDSGLPDRLRVEETIDLFARAGAADGIALLDQFGLGPRRRSWCGSLSGGERQRLFLVLALLNRPRLVILDELTQGLDPAARRDVWAAIAQLHDAGTSVLLVTHEMEEAEMLCQSVTVLRGGQVLDRGTPADLIDRHAGWATVRFGAAIGAAIEDELCRVRGVRSVERDGARLVVHGDRASIAHVGALLVATGDVPADLSVQMPGLEDALLGLLDSPPAVTAGPRELVGAGR